MSGLLDAAANNNIEQVRELIYGNVDKDETSFWFDQTPLHYAVENNNAEMVRLLLQHDFNRIKINSDRLTPLEFAANKGHWACVKEFGQYDSDPDDKARYRSVARIAIESGQFEIASALLARTRIDTEHEEIRDILIASLQSKNDAWISKVLETNLQLNYQSFCEALAIPREFNNTDHAKRMIEKGAKPTHKLILEDAKNKHWKWVQLYVNTIKDEYQRSYFELYGALLHIAIQQNNNDMVRYLLEKHADIGISKDYMINAFVIPRLPNSAPETQESRRSCTPLVAAAVYKHWDIVETFSTIDSDRNNNDRGDYGTAMTFAAYHGQLAIANKLFENGASLTKVLGHNKIRAIYCAISHWDEEQNFLLTMIEKDDLNLSAAEGVMPIALAFGCQDRSVCKKLLEKGATPFPYSNNPLVRDAENSKWENVKDFLKWAQEFNHTYPRDLLGKLLHIAVRQEKSEQVEYLLNLGADAAYTMNEKTPLQSAVDNAYWDVVRVFSRFETDANDTYKYGYALTRVLEYGDIQLALELLDMHASVDYQLSPGLNYIIRNAEGENTMHRVPEMVDGYGAIHFAVIHSEKSPDLLIRIIESGANVNLRANNRMRPLELALQEGRAGAVQILMAASSSPEVDFAVFSTLIERAKRGSLEDWSCIQAFVNHDGHVDQSKYAYYHLLLGLAVEQNNLFMVKLLKNLCLNKIDYQVDQVHVVLAARLNRWDCVSELCQDDFLQQTHDTTAYALAAFLAVFNRRNALAEQLLPIIRNTNSIITEEHLSLTGFARNMVGYDLCQIAIIAGNTEFLETYVGLYHKEADFLQRGSVYMRTALLQKNHEAVGCLAQSGCEATKKDIIIASRRESWQCIQVYFDQMSNQQHATESLLSLIVESETNPRIPRRFLLVTAARVELSAHRQQSSKLLNFLIASMCLTLVSNRFGKIDNMTTTTMMTILMSVSWAVFSNWYPENVVVRKVEAFQNVACQRIQFWSTQFQGWNISRNTVAQSIPADEIINQAELLN